MSREERIVKHTAMSGSDVAAAFIGVFLGIVAAALLIALLG